MAPLRLVSRHDQGLDALQHDVWSRHLRDVCLNGGYGAVERGVSERNADGPAEPVTGPLIVIEGDAAANAPEGIGVVILVSHVGQQDQRDSCGERA